MFNLTGVYLLNSVFVTFLTIIFFISGLTELALVISIMHSFLVCITYTLSSHSRILIVSDSSMYKLLNDYFFRIRVALISLPLIIIFFLYFYEIDNLFLIFVIIVITLLQWIFELNIAKAEIKKNHQFIKSANFFLIFIFLILCALYNFKQFNYYEIVLIVLAVYLLIHVIKSSYAAIFIKDKMIFKLKNLIDDRSVISSFFIYFSNFLWKVLITLYSEKNFAISVFIIHSFSTFISSSYNNSFGYTFLKNKKKIFGFFIVYLILTVFIALNANLFLKYLPNELTFIKNPNLFFHELILYSLIGSNFLLLAQYFRSISLFTYPEYRKNIFFADIIFSIIIVIYIILILIFMDIILIKYLFLISSLTNFFIYYYYYWLFKKL